MDPDDKYFDNGTDILSDYIQRERFEELYRAVEQLEPQQRELLKKVFLEEIKQTEIAKEEGVSNMAITNRLKKIYAKLKKIFEKGV